MRARVFYAVLTGLCLCTCAISRTITVDDDGPADFNNIQAAIDDANDGDLVIVRPGTYTGQGNRDIDFFGKAITVRGTDPSNWDIVNSTVIDCEGAFQDEHYGFHFHSGEDANSVLAGLTITGGWTESGGAIRCAASPTIRWCHITNNLALKRGAGIYCGHSPRIEHCVITRNRTDVEGGGLYCLRGNTALISNCVIAENRAVSAGGGIYCEFDSDMKVVNCTIGDNYGGGILLMASSNRSSLVGCIVWGNSGWGLRNSALRPIDVTYTNSQERYRGVGNLCVDPLFIDPETLDYRLSSDSVCINGGDPNAHHQVGDIDIAGSLRVMDGRVDMGAHETPATMPIMEVSTDAFAFDGYQGRPNPEAQSFWISNRGIGVLSWEATADCNWVMTSPEQGNLSFGEYDEIAVSVDISGLRPGPYNCELALTAPDAVNTQHIIPLTLVVGAQTLYVPSQFATIQEAIDAALEGATIVVAPGIYSDSTGFGVVYFGGKNITLTSTDPYDPQVVANTVIESSPPHAALISFAGTEDPNCVLTGFTIKGPVYGGYKGGTKATISHCVFQGGPSACGDILSYCDGDIKHCLLADNYRKGGLCNRPVITKKYGRIESCTIVNHVRNVSVRPGGLVYISNSIIQNGATYNLEVQEGSQVYVSHSNIENNIRGAGVVHWGPGVTHAEPAFVHLGSRDGDNVDLGDYHLKSQAGRWDPNSESWVRDEVTSPCIDAGDPMTPIGHEPFPNGGIVNMGAYGGTAQASKSWFGGPVCETILAGDINGDCIVDFKDYIILARHWLEQH